MFCRKITWLCLILSFIFMIGCGTQHGTWIGTPTHPEDKTKTNGLDEGIDDFTGGQGQEDTETSVQSFIEDNPSWSGVLPGDECANYTLFIDSESEDITVTLYEDETQTEICAESTWEYDIDDSEEEPSLFFGDNLITFDMDNKVITLDMDLTASFESDSDEQIDSDDIIEDEDDESTIEQLESQYQTLVNDDIAQYHPPLLNRDNFELSNDQNPQNTIRDYDKYYKYYLDKIVKTPPQILDVEKNVQKPVMTGFKKQIM